MTFRNIPNLRDDQAIKSLKAIGLLGCARDGTLTFQASLSSQEPALRPHCESCDSWTENSIVLESQEISKSQSRIFTSTPLKGMRVVGLVILQDSVEVAIKLAFLKSLARLLRHSRVAASALPLEAGKDPLVEKVFIYLKGSNRSLRMAAGLVNDSMWQRNQYLLNGLTFRIFTGTYSLL